MLLALDRIQEAIESNARRHRDAGVVADTLRGIPHGTFIAPKRSSGSGDADDGPSCVVCLEELEGGQDVASLPCMHKFHWQCIKEWVETKGANASCPICKTPLRHEGGDGDVEEGGVRAGA